MGKDKSGKSLEQVVGRIQQMFDPGCIVTYREQIRNRLGNLREFDVVIRGQFAGHPMLGVIERKDWDSKVGTPEIDAFITKSQDVNANLRMIVSPKGFTKPALRQAQDAGVGVFSLLPDDPVDAGFSIGVPWYARVYSWSNIQAHVHFKGKGPADLNYCGEDVLFKQKPIINWFLKELSTTYGTVTTLGPVALDARFDAAIPILIRGENFEAERITVTADRVLQKKRRFMQMTGDAFYDWQTNTLSVPATGAITLHQFNPDLSDWENYDGDIPQTGPYQLIIDRFFACIDVDTADVVDVPNL